MPDSYNGSHGLMPAEIVERIEMALAIDGTHDWAQVRDLLLDGRAQIFWSDHGAWITEIADYPRRRQLNVWVVAGELPDVMLLQPQVEAFAREKGCSDLIVRGARWGWKNVAREHGWEEHAVVLRKRLSGGNNE